MSQESIARFRQLLNQDKTLQQRFTTLLQSESSAEEIAALAAETGCEFTAEEAVAMMESIFGESSDGELSEFELEAVAGGFFIKLPTLPKPPSTVPSKPKPKPVVVVGGGCTPKCTSAGQITISTSSTC